MAVAARVTSWRKPGIAARSGATYSRSSSPSLSARIVSSLSPDWLFIAAARTPYAFKARTWSVISAISGDTTIVVPAPRRYATTAGTW